MLTVMDWFCGAGGSSQGAHAVPGVEVTLAANHWELAISSHAANFPGVDHKIGDIRTLPVWTWPIADIFLASPECTNWTMAKGVARVNDSQPMLFDNRTEDEKRKAAEAERSRALMEEVPAYLEGVISRGHLVKAGVVENVVEAYNTPKWKEWWEPTFRRLGYEFRVVAFNSMHAEGLRTPRAPQSRDRLYFVYWHRSIGRRPDFDKWLRPPAYCPTCDKTVAAVQVFKDPTKQMGRYRTQYVYRCPSVTCRNQVIEPNYLPAAAAIDWSLPAKRIGDRTRPLAKATMDRIKAGIDRYWGEPVLAPTGGTWRDDAAPVSAAMATRTTRENDGLAYLPAFLAPLRSGRNRSLLAETDPLATVVADGANHLLVEPLMVPCEGRDGKEAAGAGKPLRTQTTRNETGVAFAPFMVELRGGSSDARPITEAAATVTASGNHLGLASLPTPLVMRNNNPRGDSGAMSTPVNEPFRTFTASGKQSLLVPYNAGAAAHLPDEALGTLTTRDRYGIATDLTVDIDDVLFRMLEPAEIGAAMAFQSDYTVNGNKRQRVKQYGNAVTPPVMERLVSALAECIYGYEYALAA